MPVWPRALSCGMQPAAHLGPVGNWASGPVPQAKPWNGMGWRLLAIKREKCGRERRLREKESSSPQKTYKQGERCWGDRVSFGGYLRNIGELEEVVDVLWWRAKQKGARSQRRDGSRSGAPAVTSPTVTVGPCSVAHRGSCGQGLMGVCMFLGG